MNTRTRVFLFVAAGVLIASLATCLVAWATRVSAASISTSGSAAHRQERDRLFLRHGL